MVTSKNILKVPNGKLLKIFLNYEHDKINSIKITGDFFAYPETSIEELEKELSNHKLDRMLLENKISDFVETNRVEFFGITVVALVDAIMGAIK